MSISTMNKGGVLTVLFPRLDHAKGVVCGNVEGSSMYADVDKVEMWGKFGFETLSLHLQLRNISLSLWCAECLKLNRVWTCSSRLGQQHLSLYTVERPWVLKCNS